MKFGSVPTREAIGALTAHRLQAGSATLRKGSPITPEAATALEAAAIDRVVAVRLEAGDVGEDAAAARLAGAAAGDGVRVEAPFTGRANLFAAHDGLLQVRADVVDALNAVDEAVTLATLPDFRPVVAGDMVATVKIITYAVPGAVLARAAAVVTAPAVAVAPWRLRRVGVVMTLAPGLKASTVAKTRTALATRLAPAGAAIAAEASVAHEPDGLAAALADLVPQGVELAIVFGASAIADRRDVIPSAIVAAGGVIDHFGMPVDPGNLLLVGRIGAVPVIGAPGCARSPKENGFDWVLQRLLAGLPVSGADIAGMGVGGLLTEIRSRPQPRAGGDSEEE